MIDLLDPFSLGVLETAVTPVLGDFCDAIRSASETGVSAASRDGRGGWTPAASLSLYSDEPCSVQHQDPTEEYRGRLAGKQFALVFLGSGVSLKMGDMITRQSDSGEYRVIGYPRKDDDDLGIVVPVARQSP